MDVKKIISRQTSAQTPLLLKIAIGLQMWLLIGGLSNAILKYNALFLINALLSSGIQVVILIAIWNLRKWGVVAFTLMVLLIFLSAYTSIPLGHKGAVIGLLIRTILLLPALIYWRRMT